MSRQRSHTIFDVFRDPSLPPVGPSLYGRLDGLDELVLILPRRSMILLIFTKIVARTKGFL